MQSNDLIKVSHLEFIEVMSFYTLLTPSVLSTEITKSNEFWYLNGVLLGAKNKNGYYVSKNKYTQFKESEKNVVNNRQRKNKN